MNQQVKTGLGTAVLIIIAITVGAFVWIYERDKSIETNVQIVKPEPIKKAEVPKVFDKAGLEKEVFLAVELATKGEFWDKKIEVSEVDLSQKAAKGFWWAKDRWSWVAWQKEDGSWNVEVDRDGFDCNGLKNIPAEFEQFFHDAIRFNGAINCYDWKDRLSDWKTYRNEEYGFELKYPKRWSIDQSRTTLSEIVFDIGIPESREAVEFFRNDKKLTLDQIRGNKVPDIGMIEKQSEITVGGERALFVSTTEMGTSYIIFNHGFDSYIITTGGRMVSEDVLSTFKFIK